jgi:hypothetical protein
MNDRKPHSSPNTLRTLAITLGAAVGITALGLYVFDCHRHTCESCGNSWQHLGAFNVGDPGSHTCGKCGTVQWWKDGVPHVFRSVLFQPPPKVMPDAMDARLGGMRGLASAQPSAAPTPQAPLGKVRW